MAFPPSPPLPPRPPPISHLAALPSYVPLRPSLEGERHNSSDDSVATLSSTATTESDSSLSSLHSEFGAAELLNEPPRRGSADWCSSEAAEDVLQPRMEGLGLRQHGHDGSPVPPFLRPSPPPLNARPALPAIVTASSPSAGLAAASPLAGASHSAFSSSPAMSPSVSIFPQPSTSAATIRSPAPSSVPHRPSSTHSLSSPAIPAHYPAASASASSGMSRGCSSSSASPPRASHAGPTAHAYAHAPRPSSADTFSTSSTRSSTGRPWVFDSDASSVCSATSCTSASAAPMGAGEKRVMLTEDGREELVEEGGEVYKPQGDYFLDDRPEPPNTMLEIDRSEPTHVIVRVRLPGFSLENITVAMRRGHKVHIVADSYGEHGGHYEKLVMLGSDISSAAPRAEFDGTLLRIFIQRRPSRPSSAVSIPGQVAPAPFGAPYAFGAPASPAASFSPDLSGFADHARRPSLASSLASAWSTDSAGGALSPPLDTHAFAAPPADAFDAEALPPPCTARAGPPPDQKRARCLIGPEGARAAAKAAREEAAKRAREEVKNLPKEARGGRKLPFRRQKEEGGAIDGASGSGSSGGSGSSSEAVSSSATSGSCSPVTSESSLASGAGVDRAGTIKASRAASPMQVSAPPALSHHSSGGSTVPGDAATSRALESASTQLSAHLERHPDAAAPPTSSASPSPTRPKFRGNNLTLRPFDRAQSFVEAVTAAAAAAEGASSPSASSDGGGTTPRREDRTMRFTPFST
ncbi:hypothetical protein JCM10450v2_006002 [Rhodotorula kratochvilovae]